MQFLIHTVIEYDKIRVYYNIYATADGYFAEVVDNPSNVLTAGDFYLKLENDKWVASNELDERMVEWLMEDIRNHRPAETPTSLKEKYKGLKWQKLSGRIGKDVVFKQYGDKTVPCKYPDMSKRTLTDKQLRVNEKMKAAVSEAKRILADEKLRNAAQVRLDVRRKELYTALIREYFKNAGDSTESNGQDGEFG